MGNGDKTILVTGATGRQGGAVIRHMLPNGWKLRALTRNPNGYAAKQLSGQGVEIVQGDLEDPASLEQAAHGVYGIFSCSGLLGRWLPARSEARQKPGGYRQ